MSAASKSAPAAMASSKARISARMSTGLPPAAAAAGSVCVGSVKAVETVNRAMPNLRLVVVDFAAPTWSGPRVVGGDVFTVGVVVLAAAAAVRMVAAGIVDALCFFARS